ncbi:MAG: glycine betaine ABC transporter substrate-binding protein [Planctomycetota bacterium]
MAERDALLQRLGAGLLALGAAMAAPGQERVAIGAKNFTESGVLAEIMAQTIEAHTDVAVERRLNLGGTMVCWVSLQTGEIDIYAEYTGTAWSIVLKEPGKITDPLRAFLHVRRRYLAEHDIHWLEPFGLNNTYALAMLETKARELGVRRISDLVAHQDAVRAGFGIEFNNREDGYMGLSAAYGLELGSVRALEHGLAYEAIQAGAIDLMDAYSTDGKLLRYRLRVLEDDRQFFPPYNAAPLMRADTLAAHPEVGEALALLAFRLPDHTAQALNDLVETHGQSMPAVARAFLEVEGLVEGERADAATARTRLLEAIDDRPEPDRAPIAKPGLWDRLAARADDSGRLLLEHLSLTFAAVLLAALLAIPLGIAITKRPRLRQVALGAAGVVQTIPSLALLAFMIPLLGLNVQAAIAALLLYAVLPILRNTYTGITEVDPDLVDAARGMGMRPSQILRRVQLPLALRTIMAGIRTSTVISIGVATLAAFIGAGGLGEPIVEGLYLNDAGLILGGAIPAAALAVLADLGLGWLERALQPGGSRAAG